MAVTADHLIVIGRGKLIADAATEDLIARAAGQSVRVTTPEPGRLTDLITPEGGKVTTPAGPAHSAAEHAANASAVTLTVTGMRAPRRTADLLTDPVSFILQTGLGFGQLAICVLGALTMTTEYSTGVIRASLLAVPKRLPMLAAKCAVFATLIFVIGEIVSFLSFFIGKAVIHPVVHVSLSQPGVASAGIGTGLYLTVLGLFSLAIGSLIRHSAGAIAAVIGLVLVVGPLLGLLDSYDWGRHVHDWFPTVAGSY